jgi:hypothetical protein
MQETIGKPAMSKRLYQRHIPLLMVSVISAVLIIQYFAPDSPLGKATLSEITQWGVIVSGNIFVYGGVTMLVMHLSRILKGIQQRDFKGRNFYNSCVFIGTFAFFYGIVFFGGGTGGPLVSPFQKYLIGFPQSGFNLEWVFHVWAAFRMFRFTSIEATLLFIGWVLSVLRMTPLYVYLVPPLMDVGLWIGQVPSNATMRAAYLAMGISAVVLTARALVWKEPGLIEVEAVE